MADDLTKANASPWMPDTNVGNLKALGKLIEELCECASIAARCVIQGIDEAEPVTGKVNRVALQNEISDVLANFQRVRERFNLDAEAIAERAQAKYDWHTSWHEND